MADEAKYRVGMVSKMTGLSTHTLRMWEKRYAAVLPKRTEAGGRLYTDADVERLRLLHKLVGSGHSIGGIAKLPDGDLRHMAAAFPAPSTQPALRHLPEVRERVLAAIEHLRTDEAEQILSRAALSTEPTDFLKEVVGPILVEVGDRWERGELRIAHEHACSTVMRGLLFSLMRLYPTNDARRRVVVATPAKEDHELGALMVAMLAAMHGWNVLYLGPNLPAKEIAYAVTDTDAQLLMLSITNLKPKDSEREIAAIESALSERVRILVGGRAATAPRDSRVQIQQDLALVEAALSG
ncbi:MAG: MerR family transcriptional regulator [Myxococcales bacterium]|nr:MerR family transcriptional regulator [Myxococcales bacterium]MDH3843711.1 MerR family transcriptional regulator [Myxococcales bacterium]